MYGAYVNGLYRNYSECRARFPRATVLGISVFPENVGDVLDVEQGDATPAQAPGWVNARRMAGHGGPLVYCSLAVWDEVRAAFHAQGVLEPGYWIAAYPGNGAQLYLGAVGHQYQDVGPYDLSVFVDYLPGIDPAPVPDLPIFPTVPDKQYPPTPIPGQDGLMNVNFSTTTGLDGTAYVLLTIPKGCTQLLGGWVDVLDPSAGNPPHHDGDLTASTSDKSGVVCQPAVGGNLPAGTQRLRIAGGLPGHWYTGHAIFG
jgi:hypothetical protein